MKINAVSTLNAPEAIGPYSQATKAGSFVYTSGQLPADPSTGEIVAGGIENQARRVFENLKAVIEAAGSSMQKVVKTTLYIRNMEDFAAINRIYSEYFTQPYPARYAVEVSNLPKNALIEAECIAIANDDV